jgi:fructokinase
MGGAPLNIAAHAALYGFESYLISAVGDDDLGKDALDNVTRLGINADFVSTRADIQTGRCIVSLDDAGMPTYKIDEAAAFDEISAPATPLLDFDVLCFGTLALRGEDNVRTLGKIISDGSFGELYADLNIRAPFYSSRSIEFCLKTATIVKISDEELPTVATSLGIEYTTPDSVARELSHRFPNIRLLVITLGEKGSFCIDTSEGRVYRAAAQKATVLSTVGAGDSFGAAFLASYISTHDIPKSLHVASCVSAYVVTKTEAIPLGSKEVFDSVN